MNNTTRKKAAKKKKNASLHNLHPAISDPRKDPKLALATTIPCKHDA